MTAPDPRLAFADRGMYLAEADALVVADLHLGRGVASRVDAPLGDGRNTVDRLEGLLDRFEPRIVVVAGDLLHAVSWIPDGVADRVAELERAVERSGAALVVTPGNHDVSLERVYDGSVSTEHRLTDGTVVLHGHEPPERDADRYVIGHDHPALSVDGRKLPCLLYGPGHGDSEVIVLPAFDRLAAGTTVNRLRAGEFLSPLVTDADGLRPAVRDEAAGETLWFPSLGECRELL